MSPLRPSRRLPAAAVAGLVAAVFGLAGYSNLARRVEDGTNYRFFPPFQRYANANSNHDLGAEYFNIARAVAAGRGFSDPFPAPTGPTAWMPPAYPYLLAGLLGLFDGDREAVTTLVVFLQVYALIGAGLVAVLAAGRTCRRVGGGAVAAGFVVGTLFHFHSCYQTTHDPWLVLTAVTLLVAGAVWTRPFGGPRAAAGWGLFGGACALVSPVVGLCWAAVSLPLARGAERRGRLLVAGLAAGAVLCPWVVRNYAVFGRVIPVKSNLAYELYQSQCRTPDGLLRRPTFAQHPYSAGSPDRAEYAALGEVAFLDGKRDQFWAAVRADPSDFLDRAVWRFWAATVWYEPFDRAAENRRPVRLWLRRALHPLPFAGLLVVAALAGRRPRRAEWVAGVVYVAYLGPYIAVSYYERYAVPLVGVKVLLVAFAADRVMAKMIPGHRSS